MCEDTTLRKKSSVITYLCEEMKNQFCLQLGLKSSMVLKDSCVYLT